MWINSITLIHRIFGGIRIVNIEKMNVIKNRLKEECGAHPVFFIKFTKTQEYAQDILDGKLYFSPIQFFRDQESDGGKGRGDEYEARSITHFLKPATIILTRYSDSKKLEVPDIVQKMTVQVESDRNINIFCMMGYEVNDFDVISINEEEIELAFHLKKETLQDMANMFGKYFVIFMAGDFNKAVNSSFYQKNLGYVFKKCNYIDSKSEKYNDDITCGNIDRFFNKRKEDIFINQKEYRIVLTTPNNKPEKQNIKKFDCTFGINYFDEFPGIEIRYKIQYTI